MIQTFSEKDAPVPDGISLVGDHEDLGGAKMSEREPKKTIKEISPIDVYKLLPKTNCKECGEANCMAFATKVVNGELCC